MTQQCTSLTAAHIAQRLNATVIGDHDLVVSGLSPLDTPASGTITFVRARSKLAVERLLKGLPRMAVLVEPTLLPDSVAGLECTILTVTHPHTAFVQLIPLFHPPEQHSPGIHPSSVIDPTARLGDGITIGPFCVVGANVHVGDNAVLDARVHLYERVTIGARSRLYSGVVVREGCEISHDVMIHANTVIGSDGFGYVPDPSVGILKVPQVGIVRIAHHVEIGANSAIDRGAVGATVIGAHTKIDNLVQIGHNVVIGSHCIICATVGIGGSTRIGDGVVFGGGAAAADHVTISSGVRLGGRAGVYWDITEPGDYMGTPAVKAGVHRRQQALLNRLLKEKRSTKS